MALCGLQKCKPIEPLLARTIVTVLEIERESCVIVCLLVTTAVTSDLYEPKFLDGLEFQKGNAIICRNVSTVSDIFVGLGQGNFGREQKFFYRRDALLFYN